MRSIDEKPGYLAYQPGSYQVLGPEQDQLLDQILVVVPDSEEDNGTIVEFIVKTPNVRMRTRVSVVLEPDDVSVNPNTTSNGVICDGKGTLWVCEKERTRAGRPQGSPVNNVVGTGAAPHAVPTDARLWGHSFELETNGQELYGQFNPPATVADPASAAKWHLIVRYEAVVPLSMEEWNQLRSRYGIRVMPEGGITLGG